ncbi:MAG: hypothetical protein JW820_07835 [Spirochaetales bacterium]|nr:hypothetical protein [Spirochaetales bacterium]
MKITTMLLAFALSAAAGVASPAFTVDRNKDGEPDQWYELNGTHITRVSMDRNYDTVVDYTVEYDSDGGKIRETMDFDYDGVMDDFYIFDSGKLVRQEIDSNYDGRIDVWVYLDGVYIHRYEMDTDFDGQVDYVKDYAAEAVGD